MKKAAISAVSIIAIFRGTDIDFPFDADPIGEGPNRHRIFEPTVGKSILEAAKIHCTDRPNTRFGATNAVKDDSLPNDRGSILLA